MHLFDIQSRVQQRTLQIASTHGDWPCKKGCADCCRHLASEPRVSESEWHVIVRAIEALPSEIANASRQRIRESAGRERPVICPLLDRDSGACLIYDARPIACRAYGFYAERGKVLGCSQIELLSRESPDVIWGNQTALEGSSLELGPTKPLSEWLAG